MVQRLRSQAQMGRPTTLGSNPRGSSLPRPSRRPQGRHAHPAWGGRRRDRALAPGRGQGSRLPRATA
eukprot:16159509-Heterocapsa_arctica.AAC.1